MNSSERTPTVLVVEDEPLLLLVACEVIMDAGWVAVEAANATEALTVLADRRGIDVLFTDINMPGAMDGLDLARRVHQSYPSVELVVTSGKRHLADSVLPDNGTFLPKPYEPQQLVDLIATKLGSA